MESKNLVNLAFDEVEPENLPSTDRKPPIIFLHGMTVDRTSWHNVIRPIAAATGRKAYAFDARNHGDSDWSDEMSYKIMQEDLVRFMDGLPATKAILIGHSMGARTAYYFTVDKPERVEKLIVEDIGPRPQTPATIAMFLQYIGILRSGVRRIPPEVKSMEDAKKFVNDYVNDCMNPRKPQEEQRSRNAGSDGSTLPLCQREDGKFKWKANFRVLAASLGSPGPIIKGICVIPTFIIYGPRSPYKVGSQIDFIKSIFINSKFLAVEGAGHEIHLEHEDIFVKEVSEFINDS